MVFGSIVWHSQVAFFDASQSSLMLLFYVKFQFAMAFIFHERGKKDNYNACVHNLLILFLVLNMQMPGVSFMWEFFCFCF